MIAIKKRSIIIFIFLSICALSAAIVLGFAALDKDAGAFAADPSDDTQITSSLPNDAGVQSNRYILRLVRANFLDEYILTKPFDGTNYLIPDNTPVLNLHVFFEIYDSSKSSFQTLTSSFIYYADDQNKSVGTEFAFPDDISRVYYSQTDATVGQLQDATCGIYIKPGFDMLAGIGIKYNYDGGSARFLEITEENFVFQNSLEDTSDLFLIEGAGKITKSKITLAATGIAAAIEKTFDGTATIANPSLLRYAPPNVANPGSLNYHYRSFGVISTDRVSFSLKNIKLINPDGSDAVNVNSAGSEYTVLVEPDLESFVISSGNPDNYIVDPDFTYFEIPAKGIINPAELRLATIPGAVPDIEKQFDNSIDYSGALTFGLHYTLKGWDGSSLHDFDASNALNSPFLTELTLTAKMSSSAVNFKNGGLSAAKYNVTVYMDEDDNSPLGNYEGIKRNYKIAGAGDQSIELAYAGIVKQKTLTLEGVDGYPVEKEYDGHRYVSSLSPSSYFIKGLVDGYESVNIIPVLYTNSGTEGISHFSDKNFGRKTAFIYVSGLSGVDSENYTIETSAPFGLEGEITKKAISLIPGTDENSHIAPKIYDMRSEVPASQIERGKNYTFSWVSATDDLYITFTAAYAGLDVVYNGTAPDYVTINVTDILLAGADKDNYTLSAITSFRLSGIINPVDIEYRTASDNPITKDFDGTANVSYDRDITDHLKTFAYIFGILEGDTVANSYSLTGTFTDFNASESVGFAVSSQTFNSLIYGNYRFAAGADSITIPARILPRKIGVAEASAKIIKKYDGSDKLSAVGLQKNVHYALELYGIDYQDASQTLKDQFDALDITVSAAALIDGALKYSVSVYDVLLSAGSITSGFAANFTFSASNGRYTLYNAGEVQKRELTISIFTQSDPRAKTIRKIYDGTASASQNNEKLVYGEHFTFMSGDTEFEFLQEEYKDFALFYNAAYAKENVYNANYLNISAFTISDDENFTFVNTPSAFQYDKAEIVASVVTVSALADFGEERVSRQYDGTSEFANNLLPKLRYAYNNVFYRADGIAARDLEYIYFSFVTTFIKSDTDPQPAVFGDCSLKLVLPEGGHVGMTQNADYLQNYIFTPYTDGIVVKGAGKIEKRQIALNSMGPSPINKAYDGSNAVKTDLIYGTHFNFIDLAGDSYLQTLSETIQNDLDALRLNITPNAVYNTKNVPSNSAESGIRVTISSLGNTNGAYYDIAADKNFVNMSGAVTKLAVTIKHDDFNGYQKGYDKSVGIPSDSAISQIAPFILLKAVDGSSTILNQEIHKIVSLSAAFAGWNAGESLGIILSNLVAEAEGSSGFNVSNYSLPESYTVQGKGKITPRELNITQNNYSMPLTKTYNGSTVYSDTEALRDYFIYKNQLSDPASLIIDGDDVRLIIAGANFGNAAHNNGSLTDIKITFGNGNGIYLAGNAAHISNYVIKEALAENGFILTGIGKVEKAVLTVTPVVGGAVLTKQYDTTTSLTPDNLSALSDNPSAYYTLSVYGQDKVTLNYSTPQYISKNAGREGILLNITGISGESAGNYSLQSGGLSITLASEITKIVIPESNVTVIAHKYYKYYDGTTSTAGSKSVDDGTDFDINALTIDISTDVIIDNPGIVSIGNILSSRYTYQNANANLHIEISFDGIRLDGSPTVSPNYTLSAAKMISAEIRRREITVAADSVTKIFDNTASTPALTYKISGMGMVDGEALNGALYVNPNIKDVGTYNIGQGNLSDENNPNYKITFIGANYYIKNGYLKGSGGITGTTFNLFDVNGFDEGTEIRGASLQNTVGTAFSSFAQFNEATFVFSVSIVKNGQPYEYNNTVSVTIVYGTDYQYMNKCTVYAIRNGQPYIVEYKLEAGQMVFTLDGPGEYLIMDADPPKEISLYVWIIAGCSGGALILLAVVIILIVVLKKKTGGPQYVGYAYTPGVRANAQLHASRDKSLVVHDVSPEAERTRYAPQGTVTGRRAPQQRRPVQKNGRPVVKNAKVIQQKNNKRKR